MGTPVPANLNEPPIKVKHAELLRLNTESGFKSVCPKCEDGVLPVARDPSTFRVTPFDRCTNCGQAYIYEDETIAGEAVQREA